MRPTLVVEGKFYDGWHAVERGNFKLSPRGLALARNKAQRVHGELYRDWPGIKPSYGLARITLVDDTGRSHVDNFEPAEVVCHTTAAALRKRNAEIEAAVDRELGLA